MTSKHIAAGWHRNIPPASKYPIIFAGRNTHVAQILTQGLTPEEIEAHANLITAAPELLKALKFVQEAMHGLAHSADDVPEWNEGGTAFEASAAVAAAIAKAEGK